MKDRIVEVVVGAFLVIGWILMFILLGYCLIILLNAIYGVS